MTTTDTRPQVDFLKYSHTVGICVMQGRGFFYPVDAAVGNNGRLYVLSRSNELTTQGVRVTVCDLDSEFYGTFGAIGEDDGQFVLPTSIAMDSLGRVHVSDEHNGRITIFDTSGDYLGKWGVLGSGAGEFDGPSGMTFDGEDNLYISDARNNRIQKFSRDGQFLASFGAGGSGEGKFDLPWGVAVDSKGDVYVADWRNDRIQRFSPDGEYLTQYGGTGRGDGEFYRPSGVAVDDEGYIYVADWGNHRVQVLDSSGGFVMGLRGEATLSKWAKEFLSANVEEAEARVTADLEPDVDLFDNDPYEQSAHIEKLFWAPISVKLDGAGNLLVTESNRHRIQVYQRA